MSRKNNDNLKVGDKVKDLVHDVVGEVTEIVDEPADKHHAAFCTVRYQVGKYFYEAHLVEGQYEPA